MTPRQDSPRSPRERLRGWWNGLGIVTRKALRGTAIVLAVVLLAGTGWWATDTFLLTEPDLSCEGGEDEEIARPSEDAECVGITDGSYVFAENLADISRRIKAENDRVEKEAEREREPVPYATVAFLLPFTSGDPVEQGHMLRELQGAYLAQFRANREELGPNIRLVLGNTGEGDRLWRDVVDQLTEMARSPEHQLRAVAGFDVSTEHTEAAIRAITNEANLPMVAGPLTADDIQNGPENAFPGLAKVVPDNSDQAEALASHYEDIDPARTLLVEDLRENDNYVDSLRDVYRERTEEATQAPETFRSEGNEVGTLPNEFAAMVNGICNMPDVDTIYFAGRNVQLRVFVNALVDRSCLDKPYTVITISGASTLVTDEELDWDGLAESDVTVRYTSNAHPEMWTAGDVPATGGSAADYQELLDVRERADLATGDHAVGLSDSRAITMYDAVTTAIAGIRNAVTPGNAVPALDDVGKSWARMHGDPGNFVHGAGGWICLDAYGRPYNKAVAIVELDPATRDIRFVAVAWPAGNPPDPDCHIPNTP